jgi:hypothetical protein
MTPFSTLPPDERALLVSEAAVSPQALGVAPAELDETPSASQRRKRVQALEAECERWPALEAAIAAGLGALTDQQPTGKYGIVALLAQTPGVDLASAYDDLQASVVALEITRTFWEKATILHAEHHRPPELPIRDRFARHDADFEALWRHSSRADALARLATTRPPGSARSGSCRPRHGNQRLHATMRRWLRCSSASRLRSM